MASVPNTLPIHGTYPRNIPAEFNQTQTLLSTRVADMTGTLHNSHDNQMAPQYYVLERREAGTEDGVEPVYDAIYQNA